MDLTPMHKRVIALDVHQAKITACAVIEHDDGRVEVTKRDFGAFKRDRRALAQWALEMAPEVVVMESTGVYWKSPFAALEAVGLIAWVVNARHVKAVPGRKTDMADAQWLATLARAGLLRASFIPPVQMRQLRLVARQRQKLVGMCSAEKNRLHKVLVDAGIRINVLVADIHGQSARAMVKALIEGQPMHEVLNHKGRLRASRQELCEALSTEQFSAVHRFVAQEIVQHIEQIGQRIARMDQYLLQGLQPWQPQLRLLQTLPGIDEQGAAMLLVEIGADMSVFGSAEQRLASWVGTVCSCMGAGRERTSSRPAARSCQGPLAVGSSRQSRLRRVPGQMHTLKDAVLGYTASPQVLLEAGRIRLRQGVALGYNPTDFFRDGSVRSEVSMDPASLRENRQGSGMVHVQQLGADGTWQFAYSPRLAQRKPAPSGWHPDWGATNHQHRALLAFAPRWGESLSAQGLLHLRQGHRAQWGLNLSGLVDQATVAHLEWAAGLARTQWHEALDLPGPQRWRHRLAAGATHTTRHKLTLTAELHYNGTAPGRSAWQALRGEPLPAYLQYRAWSLQALEPPTRWALFFHATWKDALMPGLDLSSLWHLDRVDASRRFWLEARYRGKAFDVALQWQRNHGAPLSQFGLWPTARRWELSVRRYF